ncbi:antitoxin HipB [Actinomadura rubteroloni]|uniref:Antitoxin HipB n=1 Tax=Actinomadura rubteroloni TaxID=1926885 RepID=A0A2P4UMF6_9ACTN|nr:helix-turn-helix transcriptional regulator [Actinomadura rubteroloni]POM26233.1 antitoxin HipB [Actinomadura rubteroloni]
MLEPDEIGRRRDLADALKDLRRTSGLTGDRLAARCGISQGKISKIENAKVLPSLADLERLLDALRATADVRDEIYALARLANTEYESLRTELRRGLQHKQRELAAFEATADHIRFFLPSMITGLLQTPRYARASLAMFPGDHAEALARRLVRQKILDDPSKRFSFLFTEQALRWPLCEPSTMADQISRIMALLDLPHITMGVVPLGAHVLPDGPMNTFTVYDDRLATAETFSGVLMMRDPRDVSYHLEVFGMFQRHAALGPDMRGLLEEIRRELISGRE